MIEFTLNGQAVRTEEDPDTPLLWVVRDTFKLKGTKFGCGAALCGACTMHVDGAAVRTCTLPVRAVAGKDITTIEGLGTPDDLHPLQEKWVELSVPQCGYCQPGQIMSGAALLAANPVPRRPRSKTRWPATSVVVAAIRGSSGPSSRSRKTRRRRW